MKVFDARRNHINLFVDFFPKTLRSVDPMVWPSIFDTHLAPGFTESRRIQLGYSSLLKPPPWIGRYPPFWDEYDQLCCFIKENKIANDSYTLIMVTDINANPTDRFRLIGYDVITDSFISGISNFFPNNIKNYQNELNENFLFEQMLTAKKFARTMEEKFNSTHPSWSVKKLWLKEKP